MRLESWDLLKSGWLANVAAGKLRLVVAPQKTRSYSPIEFHLRMSRAEIGSYLGMTLETVSRTFSAFQHQHLLEVDKRHIRMTDMSALSRALEMHMH